MSELQLILDTVAEGLCGLDAAGNATFCNDAFLKMTGYRTEEVVGNNLHALLHPRRPDGTKDLAEVCALCKVTDFRREIHLVGEVFWRKDGTSFPTEYRSRPVESSSSVTECVATIHDIVAEIRHAKEELSRRVEKEENEDPTDDEESEKEALRMPMSNPDVAWTSDRRRRTIYISPMVETVCGYTAQEIDAPGANFWLSRIHPDDADRVHQAYRALFERQCTYDEEYRFHRKDNAWIWVHDRALGTREENGVLCADGILSDVTRRKQAEIELQSKTAFLEAQANSTIDGILVVGRGNQRIMLNERMVELFNIPPAIRNTPDDHFLLDHAVTMVKDPESFLARVNHLYDHPYEIARDEVELKNGMTLDRYSSPVVDKKGTYYGRIWSFRDITERKRNEDTLQQLSMAVEQSPVSVVITDPQGDITYVNRKFTDCTGYSLEEVAGKNPRILNSGHTSRDLYQTLWATIKQGREWHGEFCNKKKNGEIYWEAATITPITNAKGAIVHFLAVKEDITERRRAEEALNSSEKRYRLLFERNRAGVYRTTVAGRILECNQALARMFGYDSPQEVMAVPIIQWYDNPADREPFLVRLRSEKCVTDYEIRFRRKNGEVFWVIGNISLIDDDAGEEVIEGTIVDISAVKRTEKKLQLAQFSLEHASDGIFWIDSDARICYVNLSTCRSLGFSREELLSMTIPDIDPLFPKETWGEFWEKFKGLGSMTFESQHKTKEGRIFPIEVRLTHLTFDGREYGFAFVRDMTERKRSEKELQLAQFSLEHASEAIQWMDPHGHIVYANDAACRSLGRSREELVALSIADIDPLCPQETWAPFWEKLQKQGSMTFEGLHKTKQGRTFPVEITANYMAFEGQEYSFAFARDITERKRAAEEIQDSSEQIRLLLDSIPEAVYGIDLNGKCTFCSPSCLQILGYQDASELLGRNMHEVMHHTRADGTPYPVEECHIFEAFRVGHGTHIEDEVVWRRDGTSFPAEYWSHPMHRGGTLVGAVVTFIDITERVRTHEALRESEERYRLLFQRNMAGIFRTTPEGRVLECNPAAAHLFGCDSPEEFTSLSMMNFYDSLSDRDELMRKLHSNKSLTNYEMRFRRKNGEYAWAMLNMSLIDGNAGAESYVEGTFVDITERKVAEERVQSLAYYDALTGLPNRTLLRDRLSQALAMASRQKHKVALLFLDLDRFKIINDSLGHSVGDVLLQQVAERLKKCARAQDTIARLGGDEFLIVLTNQKDTPDVAVAAERFMDAMTAGFDVQGHSLSVSCSLGISIFPEHGSDSEALIKNADAAMYSAKDRGRNNIQFFTADMNVQAVERLTLENGLRLALDRKEFFLVYQPQMEISTGKIIGLEALLRWKHPELGLVPPDEFIRIAENSGLIMPIGEWVLRTACTQAQKWQQEGLPPVVVAVNVSAVQFRQECFPTTIRRVLEETGLPPQYLELELTESLLLSNADVMFSVFKQLTAMGLSLAIDDFGTGYSSLSYLKHYPVSRLKIDRSFIRDVAANPDDAAIATAIISMAKSLNLKVIAEGVENEADMSFLREHHCDEIQGYYFSKPLAAEDAARKLRSNYSEVQARAHASGKQS